MKYNLRHNKIIEDSNLTQELEDIENEFSDCEKQEVEQIKPESNEKVVLRLKRRKNKIILKSKDDSKNVNEIIEDNKLVDKVLNNEPEKLNLYEGHYTAYMKTIANDEPLVVNDEIIESINNSDSDDNKYISSSDDENSDTIEEEREEDYISEFVESIYPDEDSGNGENFYVEGIKDNLEIIKDMIDAPLNDISSLSSLDKENKVYVDNFSKVLIPFLSTKRTKEEIFNHIKDNLDNIREEIDIDFDILNWNIDEKERTELKPIYKKFLKIIKDETPSMDKILKSKLSDDDKKKCILLFKIMCTVEEGGPEYNDYRNFIVDQLEKASHRVINNEHDELEKKLKELVVNKNSIKDRIFKLNCSENIKAQLYSKYLRLESISPTESEYSLLKNQLEWALSLPYDNMIEIQKVNDNSYFRNVQEVLDKKLFGLKNVKQKLLLLLNNSFKSKNSNKAVALCGPPGIGKTSIASAFAESIGLPFESVSLGGSKDSTLFYGSDNVYIGAGPGIIVRILKNMKCSNGVILFDEIDKIEDRETQYALLHITDFTQNKNFRDKYLADIPIDLSKLFFFYSMNDDKNLDRALKNRLPIIYLEDYTVEEKKIILRDYILKQQLAELKMDENDVIISDEVINKLVKDTSSEDDSGIRNIKTIIKDLVSKLNFYKTLDGDIEGFEDLFNNKLKEKITFPFILNLEYYEKLVNPKITKELSYYM